MTPSSFFQSYPLYDGSSVDLFIFAVMAVLGVLLVVLQQGKKAIEPNIYSPRLAWVRGGIYFCICFILSWASGVLKTVLYSPFIPLEHIADPMWLILTGLSIAVCAFAYFYWWPQGTVTHDRKLYLLPTVLFGTLWGLSEGQLFMVVYAFAESFGGPRLVNALAVFVLMGGFNGLYHANWWDIYISPPHNIRAWNMKKVIFGHTPFLIVTLTYLTLYGSAGIYLALQTVALLSSVLVMRFPPFWLPDGGYVDKETGFGI